MLNTLFLITKIDMISIGNQTLNTFSKLPILKRIFNNKIYKNKFIVIFFSILGIISKIFKLILLNFLITFVLLFLPITISDIFKTSIYTGFITIIPLLVLFTSKTFNATESKYINVYLLKVKAKTFFVIELIKYLILNFIFTNFTSITIF